MSGKLVGEVVEWLRTPAASGVSVAERCILLIVAERCREDTRVMLRHRGDEEPLVERLAGTTGLGKDGLKKAFQRLAKRGLEVRIPIKTAVDGRPVFAHEGKSMSFRLPEFPASYSIPERGDEVPPSEPAEPVDNSPREAPKESPGDVERGDAGTPLSAQRGEFRPPEGGRTSPLKSLSSPSKDSTSEKTRGSSSAFGAVEDAQPPTPIFDEQKFDQGEYLMAQQQLLSRPDFGASLVAQIEAEHPNARRELHVIHAARLAAQGAHA